MGAGNEGNAAVAASTQGESFARLAGHARVLGSAAALLVKLGLVGAAGMPWMIIADETRFRVPNELQPMVAFLALMTGLVWMCVTAHWRRWHWVAALVGVAVSVAGFALWSWYLRATWYSYYGSVSVPSVQKLCGLIYPAAIGGCIGSVVVWMVCRRMLGALGVSGAFVGAFADFGTPQEGGYRPALDSLLTQAERGLAWSLLSLRSLSVCMAVACLAALAWEWIRTMSYSRRTTVDLALSMDAAAWLAIGIVVGAVLGVLLMPAGRLRSILAVLLLYVTSIATGLGFYHVWRWRPIPSATSVPAIMFAISAAAAVVSTLLAQFVARSAIRTFMPIPIQRHLLGNREARVPEQATGGGSAQCCEECGYHLDGLPTTTCEGCGTAEFRCPECGHCQPAGTLHARAMHRLCKTHIALRVGNWLLALAACGIVLIPWIFIGSQARHIARVSFREWLGLFLVTLVLVAPLRFVLMHWRPWIVGTLLAALLPTVAMLGGASLGSASASGIGESIGLLVVTCVLASAVFPLLWRGWLHLMLPWQAAKQAHAWHISRAFRWRSDAMTEHAGTEIALVCQGCGTSLRGSAKAACAQCGVMLAGCAYCSSRSPITKVRAGFESMVHRGRAMVLVQLSAIGLALCLVFTIVAVEQASRVYEHLNYPSGDATSVWAVIANEWLAFAMAGALAGIVLMARGKAIAAVGALAMWAIPAVLTVAIVTNDSLRALRQYPALTTVVAGLLAAITFISALLAQIFLDLAARALLPKENAAALLAWLGGRTSLDDAGASLSRNA